MDQHQAGIAQKFARALVDLYESAGLDGIADEMSWATLDKSNEFYAVVEEARQYLGGPHEVTISPAAPPENNDSHAWLGSDR